MTEDSGSSALHWRVGVLIAFGAIIGAGSAIEFFTQGEYVKAVVGGVVFATCLGVAAWALQGRAWPSRLRRGAAPSGRGLSSKVGREQQHVETPVRDQPLDKAKEARGIAA